MLRYLVDPIFQVINTAGKPATGGYIEVYLHGTRDKYYCASDFDGTLHPFKIPLDSLGSNIILADDTNAYDIYVYNRYGSLLMSRYKVSPVSIDDIVESLDEKKDKQIPVVAEGSPTKTIKKITQTANGNISVEFENIDFPYNIEISSPDDSIEIGTPEVDPELKKETIPISVKSPGLVKANPEDTNPNTLIEKLEVVDTVRDPEDPDDPPLLSLETTVDVQGNRKVAINEDNLRTFKGTLHDELEYIINQIGELPNDEHGYFNSSLYTTPGDGTTTNLVMDNFRISQGRDVHGDSIEFVPTHQEGGVDFGEVWLEPGTYILATQFTLQWVGNPRGTFLPLVANVADQPFDFSYEHEDVVRTTRIITRTTRGKLVVNIAIDADTPPMGVWVKNLEVAQIASYTNSAVIREATQEWLDEHPEATTTVQDNSLTEAKFSNALKLQTVKDYVTPEMFGAVGDGVEDDTAAIAAAVAAGDYILLDKQYKTTDTIYLTGYKNVKILGSVTYYGQGVAFYLSGHKNSISNGRIVSTPKCDAIIKINSVDKDNRLVPSYWNRIENVFIINGKIGVYLYNNEVPGTASYFNEVLGCTFSDCTDGVKLECYANGNVIDRCVFYNCGVANSTDHAAILLEESNGQPPLENHISRCFLTNSTDCTTISIKGSSQYNSFCDIITEPGGANGRSIYCSDMDNVKDCYFQFIDVTNLGSRIPKLSNTIIAGYNIYFPVVWSPQLRSKGYAEWHIRSTISVGEDQWVELGAFSLVNNVICRISFDVIYHTGVAHSQEYTDEIKTNIYLTNGTYHLTNNTQFKVEDGKLYYKTPPTIVYGTYVYGSTYGILKLLTPEQSIGVGQAVELLLSSNWVVE